MQQHEPLTELFEAHRPHLRAVAYRMLGSLSDAEDALQDAWLRVSRAGMEDVKNPRAWLTTVVSRICLNMLQSRRLRREQPLDVLIPDPIVSAAGPGPEDEVLLADAVGLALMVVLDTLTPAERLAFVLHDLFAISFDDIAAISGRTPAASRQLASRARRRVQGTPLPDAGVAAQRRVVDAFLAASRHGDFDSLLAVLDPEVVLRADYGPAAASRILRGATAVSRGAVAYANLRDPAEITVPALVNGVAGLLTYRAGVLASVLAFTVRDGRIATIDIIADPDRLQRLHLPDLRG